jgi:Mg-chelatase subunit ChlD
MILLMDLVMNINMTICTVLTEDRMGDLFANGGTNIYSGMTMGMDILAARRQKNALTCMFLLTDGQDGSNHDARQV